MSDLTSQLIALGEQLSSERNAAHDLWTWLPSYAVAQRHHGDYAGEHQPSNCDVMTEAALYLGHIKHPEQPLDATERKWFEQCPCGEEH